MGSWRPLPRGVSCASPPPPPPLCHLRLPRPVPGRGTGRGCVVCSPATAARPRRHWKAHVSRFAPLCSTLEPALLPRTHRLLLDSDFSSLTRCGAQWPSGALQLSTSRPFGGPGSPRSLHTPRAPDARTNVEDAGGSASLRGARLHSSTF